MHLRFALFADYVAEATRGKLVIVGTFDTVFDALGRRPIPLPGMFIVASFEASISEGTEHRIALHFVDDNGNRMIDPIEGPIVFAPRGPLLPALGQLRIAMPSLQVPDAGEYRFEFYVDDAHVGGTSLFVVPAPHP